MLALARATPGTFSISWMRLTAMGVVLKPPVAVEASVMTTLSL